jgi:hypothetical protein
LGVQRSGVVEVGDQEGKDAAGDVAHEAAADLFGAFAVAGFLVDVGAGRGVVDILQLKNLVLTAPDDLRESLRDLNTKALLERCARMHRARQLDTLHATRHALRTLARRHNALTDEIAQVDALLADLTAKAAPRLLTQTGIGPQIAARLLLVAGDNPTRLRNDAALAALCGASPVEASSGKTIRHRLNRGGDRQANSALWLIATNRMIAWLRALTALARVLRSTRIDSTGPPPVSWSQVVVVVVAVRNRRLCTVFSRAPARARRRASPSGSPAA